METKIVKKMIALIALTLLAPAAFANIKPAKAIVPDMCAMMMDQTQICIARTEDQKSNYLVMEKSHLQQAASYVKVTRKQKPGPGALMAVLRGTDVQQGLGWPRERQIELRMTFPANPNATSPGKGTLLIDNVVVQADLEFEYQFVAQ